MLIFSKKNRQYVKDVDKVLKMLHLDIVALELFQA